MVIVEGGSQEEQGREEGKVDGEIKSFKKWLVAGNKKKASTHDDAKATAQRTAGQRVKQIWDCSQIENEKEEEEEDLQKEDQMAAQWDEEQKLEDILERRRMEGIIGGA